MQSKSIENPEQYAKIILGDTSRAQHAPYLRVEAENLSPVTDIKYWDAEIQAEGIGGHTPIGMSIYLLPSARLRLPPNSLFKVFDFYWPP